MTLNNQSNELSQKLQKKLNESYSYQIIKNTQELREAFWKLHLRSQLTNKEQQNV